MDAHLFRRYCEELLPVLVGARFEKVYQPLDGLLIIALDGVGRLQSNILNTKYTFPYKVYLSLKEGRKFPLLFHSTSKIAVASQPTAQSMRFRKYLSGKRIERICADWLARCLYIEVQGDVYLSLSLRDGPMLLFEKPTVFDSFLPLDGEYTVENFEKTYAIVPQVSSELWPDWTTVSLCDPADWRQFSILTPLLRKTLPLIENLDAAALYADLEAGGGDIFVYDENARHIQKVPQAQPTQQAQQAGAWSLPSELQKELGLSNERCFESALDAISFIGSSVFSEVARKARGEAVKPFIQEHKRLDKLLEKLEDERLRLNSMLGKKVDALLLQASLYSLNSQEKKGSLDLVDMQGESHCVVLDPRFTIQENMQRFFHSAGRGKRGLEYLEKRFETIAFEQEKLLSKANVQEALPFNVLQDIKKSVDKSKRTLITNKKSGVNKGSKIEIPKKIVQLQKKKEKTFPSQVQVFRSSDGFIILRGRDNKGNALALKLAGPNDYWVHTADGPSAHVIIRRDHAEHLVPQSTFDEAGILASLKSWLKDAPNALIQFSMVKHISPMKNAGPGMVRINKSQGTFTVEIQKGLEEKLKG